MPKVTISGVPSFDGEYDVATSESLNGHELHLIKKVSGVRLGEIEEAAAAGDYDLFVAFAVIALWRAGKVTRQNALAAADTLLTAEAGALQFEMDAEEADASPPEQTQSDAPVASDESSPPSSAVSNGIGDDRQVTNLLSTGSPG